jgi:hypothetical protein
MCVISIQSFRTLKGGWLRWGHKQEKTLQQIQAVENLSHRIQQSPCMEHLWQKAVMSPSIDLKILESYCDMSSESHSSLGKWLLYFYWASAEWECLDTCSQVIMEPEVTIVIHPTLNWTQQWSIVRGVAHKRFGWRISQRCVIYKIANWTSGLSQALW